MHLEDRPNILFSIPFSQPIAGLIAGRYGGKWVFGLGNFITAIGTLLSPVIANVSKELFIVVRVIEGLAEVNRTDNTCIVSYTSMEKIQN